MVADKTTALTGIWKCQVWYPNKDDSGEDYTVNTMKAQLDKQQIVMTSDPHEEGSYMIIRLFVDDVDDQVVTGRWHETTSSAGDYEGAMYTGAGQLILDASGKHMEGLWAGAGLDRTTDKLRVYTGRWQLDRIQ